MPDGWGSSSFAGWPRDLIPSLSLFMIPTMDYGLQMAGAVFSILLILVVFLLLRQRFVRGVTMTGLKS